VKLPKKGSKMAKMTIKEMELKLAQQQAEIDALAGDVNTKHVSAEVMAKAKEYTRRALQFDVKTALQSLSASGVKFTQKALEKMETDLLNSKLDSLVKSEEGQERTTIVDYGDLLVA